MRDHNQWRRVRTLLEEVVDRRPEDRPSYLQKACAGEPEIREEVESLLRAHEAAGDFLESAPVSAPSGSPAPAPPAALAPGTRLGAFEIQDLLGAGGMGQVYRARDTRLDRSVAIKILSPDLAADVHGRERFEREARAVSRLTHARICVLHDVGRATVSTGVEHEFLVMELIEGEPLTTRLARGALSLDQSLTYAIQIAEALAAAHAQGIVHRDLKPANIMLAKGGVKLVDFGLARLLEPAVTADAGPTGSTLTGIGLIAGTLPYMSPEQVRGDDVDARSDVFAFGAVLYEMLSGRRAFDADSRSGLIAMILERDPPRLSEIQPAVPPALDRLVKACLAKDPAQRWQHAHDIALELKNIEELTEGHDAPVRSQRPVRALGWTLAAIGGLAIGWLVARGIPASGAGTSIPRRLMVDVAPVVAGQAWSPVVSPDGRMVAFLGGPDYGNTLFVHHLDTGVTRQLTTLAGFGCASSSGWSSDGRTLFYAFGETLRAVDVATGTVTVLAHAPPPVSKLDGGASEGAGGTILVGGPRLRRLLPGERMLRDVFRSDPTVTLQVWPRFLPDGREFLFTQGSNDPARTGVFLGSLDSDRVVRLLGDFSNAALSPTGHLVFGRGGAILAQPFNRDGRAPAGEPAVIVSRVANASGYTPFALGADNTIVYVADEGSPTTALEWYDRGGHAIGAVGTALAYRQVALAPDGRRISIERFDHPAGTSSLWILDLARGTMVAANPAVGEDRGLRDDGNLVWAPDGRRLAFTATVDAEVDLFLLNPQQPPVRLARPGMQYAKQWSADGRFILYTQVDSATKNSLWALPLEGDRTPIVLVDSASLNDSPQLSPDGHWLAYGSNESGRAEVYVQKFPGAGDRVRLSTDGGGQPKWRGDGRELFYVTGDGTMMAVAWPDHGEPGQPRALFRTSAQFLPYLDQYAVTSNGQRFLVISPSAAKGFARLDVISNWPALLDK